jgi:streptomycin 3"-adenylyltransferase
LVAAYLHGSLAFGEFRPDMSDVDVLVVVDAALSDEARRRLGERLLDVPLPGPLELSVVTAEAARGGRLPLPYEVHVGGGRVVLDRGAGDPDLAAHVTATLARGRALESILDDFDEAMASGLTAGGGAATDAILNACRVLQTLASPEGTVVSKEEAAAWGLERLPAEHRPLVAAALGARRDPGASVEWDPEALRRFRTFAVGAAVRRRPGRKVAGLP